MAGYDGGRGPAPAGAYPPTAGGYPPAAHYGSAGAKGYKKNKGTDHRLSMTRTKHIPLIRFDIEIYQSFTIIKYVSIT